MNGKDTFDEMRGKTRLGNANVRCLRKTAVKKKKKKGRETSRKWSHDVTSHKAAWKNGMQVNASG